MCILSKKLFEKTFRASNTNTYRNYQMENSTVLHKSLQITQSLYAHPYLRIDRAMVFACSLTKPSLMKIQKIKYFQWSFKMSFHNCKIRNFKEIVLQTLA